MATHIEWDLRFMALAQHIGQWSKDRSRKVGCVIVGPEREIVSVGYNGFPRGVADGEQLEGRHKRPEKYRWTEHAERNAIYNAARSGAQQLGASVLYVPFFPCCDCARAIIQVGIRRVVAYAPDFHDPTYGHDFHTAATMLEEAGVFVQYVAGEPPQQQP